MPLHPRHHAAGVRGRRRPPVRRGRRRARLAGLRCVGGARGGRVANPGDHSGAVAYAGFLLRRMGGYRGVVIYYRERAFRDVSGRFGKTPGSAKTLVFPGFSCVFEGRGITDKRISKAVLSATQPPLHEESLQSPRPILIHLPASLYTRHRQKCGRGVVTVPAVARVILELGTRSP
jgi:hypothetical protein